MEDITNYFKVQRLRLLKQFTMSLNLDFIQNEYPYFIFDISIQECYLYCLMNPVSHHQFLHFDFLILYNMDLYEVSSLYCIR